MDEAILKLLSQHGWEQTEPFKFRITRPNGRTYFLTFDIPNNEATASLFYRGFSEPLNRFPIDHAELMARITDVG